MLKPNKEQMQLLRKISSAYPDGLVLEYVKHPKEDHGDTLAKFIAVEVTEVTAGLGTLKVMKQTAKGYLETARQELDKVIQALV